MNALDHLVSPVAEGFAPRRPAARQFELVGAVGLVDEMLNRAGVWGPGILDAVEAELRARHAHAVPKRIVRPQFGATPAEIWATAMADRYAALVIAAGD